MAQVQTKVAWIKENVTWPATLSRKGQDRGDSRTRLSGLEGHPVFPVTPCGQGMASLWSGLTRWQLPARWRLEVRFPGRQALYQLSSLPQFFPCSSKGDLGSQQNPEAPVASVTRGMGRRRCWECKSLWSSENLDKLEV